MEKYFQENDIQVLEKIPYDKKFVDALVNLIPIVEYDKKYRKVFEEIIIQINKEVKNESDKISQK